MNLSTIIRRVTSLATQIPSIDSDAREIVLDAIDSIQREGHFSFNKTSTTATVTAGGTTGVFANTNEYLGLQLGAKTSVLVSENSESGVLPVHVMTEGEVLSLHRTDSGLTRARVHGIQVPVWISLTTTGAGQINLAHATEGQLIYTIKARILLARLSGATDSNELTRQYPNMIIAKARGDALRNAGLYNEAEAEDYIYQKQRQQALHQDAYKALNGQPVRM